MDLSSNIRAFVSQRLIPTVDNKRCAAIEIMLGTPMISELILKGEFEGIKEIMDKSEQMGMATFDNALFRLFQAGKISKEEALKNADSANNVRLKIKFADEGGEEEEDGSMKLSLEDKDDQEDANTMR